jgi:hypothetical protein
MKKILILFITFLSLTSSFIYSQCSVNIVPQGSINLCDRDSLVLDAVATGGGIQIDQCFLDYNSGTGARTLPGYSIWQSFTAGITGTMAQVDFGFFNYINGTCNMIVYQGSGTYGLVLDNHPINVNCPSGNCMLPFALNIHVIAGQKYTIQIIPGAGMPDPYGIQTGTPATYSGGKFGLVDPSGVDSMTIFDWVFRTWVGNNLGYLWSTGSAGTSTTIHSSGAYYVTVSDSAGCLASDTIVVTSAPNPVVHLGNDTTICTSCSLTLNAGAGFASYYWSTGQATPTINVNTADTFWVEVTNGYGCITRDTIIIQISTVGVSETKTNDPFIINSGQGRGEIYIYLSSGLMNTYTAAIVDLSGRQIFKQQYSGIAEIDIHMLKHGIYFLNIWNKDILVNKKIFR